MTKVICKTEFSTITFDEKKRRFYQEFGDFWENAVEEFVKEIASEGAVFSRFFHEQLPERITALLDLSKLKIMHPHIAETVYPALKHFLESKQVQAIAIIENPEYGLVKLQAKRILKLTGSDDRIVFFTDRCQAEVWLDEKGHR